jgi:hypothetical protein
MRTKSVFAWTIRKAAPDRISGAASSLTGAGFPRNLCPTYRLAGAGGMTNLSM